ncbi:MAG: D-alanyl-D-alanine carboxypeptidase [Kiritimatiellaceae bacterium]|nr:D-alanyl-D-alanine carboxypeptidase [Kiritimatiellaceae bacterium]
MKKCNVTFIAAALIALHVLVFVVFIGTKGDKKPAIPKQATTERTSSSTEQIELPEVKVPELKIPDAPPIAPMPTLKSQVIPVEVVEIKPPAPLETIATPGTRSGYLRSNRPIKRTKEVFAELKNDPYQSAIVVDARTGKILFQDRATVYSYPASITKMMTMLITLEQIDAGLIHLSDKVKITKEVAGIGGSGVYLDVRESGAFTVDDMLKATMVHSANDAATALAVHVAGDVAGFVDMMNQKARELGMNSTTYHTPHGLPITAQPDISTAYDIAILSLAVLRHPQTLNYSSTKLAWLPTNSLRKEKFMLANRNALVGKKSYPGCDGLKTGYHSKGGSSLTATAKQGENRIIAVTLGCPDKNVRDIHIRKLLDKGFQALKK